MTNLTTIQDVWRPATEAEKAGALASLAVLPSRQTSSAGLDRAVYYVALDGVTRYGLSRAVTAILQNALGHAFFPSPPELRAQCDRAMEHHERARQRERRQREIERDRIPDRPEPSQAEKDRVAAIMAEFHAGYEQVGDEETRAEVRARLGMTDEIMAAIPDNPDARKQAAE